MEPARVVVLGLDLSARGAGAVAVPSDWGGDWSKIARLMSGEDLPAGAASALRIGRLHRIAADVVTFAGMHGCTTAVVEQYALRMDPNNPGATAQAHTLAEVGGVVKHQLVEKLGLITESVAPASARKVLLGRVPQKGSKAFTLRALKMMGIPEDWTPDQKDAFVCANWAMSAIGGFALVTAEPVDGKRKRGRAA